MCVDHRDLRLQCCDSKLRDGLFLAKDFDFAGHVLPDSDYSGRPSKPQQTGPLVSAQDTSIAKEINSTFASTSKCIID